MLTSVEAGWSCSTTLMPMPSATAWKYRPAVVRERHASRLGVTITAAARTPPPSATGRASRRLVPVPTQTVRRSRRRPGS